jgi:hypothetical protein
MNAVSGSVSIRRIVVKLDSGASGLPALQVAVRLAAALGAELEGVFVEDINLVRLASLPFSREVRALSLGEQAISAEGMQRELRVLARQAEQALAQAAAASGVSCSFRVWRGHTGVEHFSASFEADILSLGAGGLSSAYHGALPLLSARVPGRVVSVETINVLFGDSPRSCKALAAACHLAGTLNAAIRVLLPPPADVAGDLQRLAAEVLAAHGRQAGFVRLGEISPTALAERIGRSAANVLIADIDHPLLRRAGVAHCLEQLAGTVLLVR